MYSRRVLDQRKWASRSCTDIMDMASWLQVMISTYLLALTVHMHSEYFFTPIFPPSTVCIHCWRSLSLTHTKVYIAEIISEHNRTKGREISSCPPRSSPRLIFPIISSLVLLCVAHSRYKTSASREAVFMNISIYGVQKGHKQRILGSSRTNSF